MCSIGLGEYLLFRCGGQNSEVIFQCTRSVGVNLTFNKFVACVGAPYWLWKLHGIWPEIRINFQQRLIELPHQRRCFTRWQKSFSPWLNFQACGTLLKPHSKQAEPLRQSCCTPVVIFCLPCGHHISLLNVLVVVLSSCLFSTSSWLVTSHYCLMLISSCVFLALLVPSRL